MKRVTYACLLAFACASLWQPATAQLASSCWPKFHRDRANSGQGLYAGTGSELTWTYTTGGAVKSSPVLGVDGTSYCTSDDGKLYAIGGDGAPRWSFTCNCSGSPSPAVASDGTVYAGSTENYIYALNSNGTLKWKRGIGSRIQSSIAVATDGTLYFGCIGSKLYALRSDGTQKWSYSTGGNITSTPAIGSDGTVYFGCMDGSVYALNSSGTLKWKLSPPSSGGFAASPAIGSDGTIYIGSTGGFFYGIQSNGTQKFRANSGGDVRSSAAIAPNGNIIYGCRDNKIHALNSIGAEQWTFNTGHYVDSSPAIGIDGGIYVGSLDGNLYALNPDGTERWHYAAGSGILSSPAVGVAGALFVGADNGVLYCFAADDTPPVGTVANDDGAYTSILDRLHGSWSATDPESGIFSYEYCIGTAPGLADVAGWLSMGTATQHTRTGLSLVDTHTYYITVRATNGAGLRSPDVSSDGIIADATGPTTPIVTDSGRYTPSATTLTASWSATDPESGIGGYQYSIGTSPGGVNVVGWTDAGSSPGVTRTGLSLVTGTTYYFNVKARNGGGIYGPVGSSDGITVDASPPSTPVVTDSGEYISDPTSIQASWMSSDGESGIAKFEYSVGSAPGGIDALGWTDAGTSLQATIAGLSLANGVKYYVNVRATNGAGGMSAVGSANGVTLDTTPPSTPTVTDDGVFTATTSQLHAAWTASDPESGISLYKYAIGTTPGGTNIVGWTEVGTSTSVTRGGLALVDKQIYYISVMAVSGAGASSAVGTSDGITVDATSPTRPAVIDDGQYTLDATRLHARWSSSDPESGVVKFEYSIGTSADGTDVRDWTNAGLATELTVTGLSLQSGVRYYFNVRATNGAGGVSQVGNSDGIFVETTPPTRPVVTDQGPYTQSLTSLAASWTSEDPETGVAGYSYCIGTTPGDHNISPWTDVGLTTSVARTNLTLTHGTTYYFSVKAVNGIGMVSEVGSSEGTTVDTTAPGTTTVTDDGAYSASTDELHVTLSCQDPESGIASYECAVGTTAGGRNVLDWTDQGPGPEVTITGLTLTNGASYYVTARATNGAGIKGQAGVSDGIVVDATPPIGLAVWDDGAYTGSQTSLHGWWSARDPESGIGKYRYCIGSAPGLNDVADWLDVGAATSHTREGLSLVSGQTYYITVIAVNTAGGESAPVSSDGIILDLTPPSTPVVTDSGTYWGYRTNIWGSWSAQDPESGIAEYEMSVGTTAGADDVASWMSVGDKTSYTRSGLLLTNGVTYYINVRAKNGAGLGGGVGSSDGVMIDSTPPTTPVVTDDGDTTAILDRLHAVWHSADPESGLAGYFYCVGTSPGATDVAPWTDAGLTEDVTVTGITLDPVLRYYFSVKARNKAGAWSAVSSSDGIGFGNGAAIWWKFRNDSANLGRGLFNATTVNDVGWIIPTQGYVESSPAIAVDGTTYIGSSDGKLYAITQNGTVRWTYSAGATIDSSPAISPEGNAVFGCENGKLYCVSSAGGLVWAYQTGGGVKSSPLIDNGTAYVGSGDGCLYAIKMLDGSKLWSYATGGPVKSSPAMDAGKVIYVASDDSYIHAVNPTGTRKWRFRTGSSIDGSPAVGPDGVIYIGSGDANLYAINPNGTEKWRLGTTSVVDSSPAVGADGNVYFGVGFDGSVGRLYAVRPDKSVIWHVDIPGGIVGSPAVDPSGNIYVGACDNKMYAFRPNGTVLWTYQTQSSVVSSPALGADSSVVFGSYDGNVYCLRDITSKDLTPPTTPVVTVPGSELPAGQSLTVSWLATDPESMVAEYVYAVGTGTTAPDNANAIGWTSAGIETSVALDGVLFTVGQTYYVSVKARNPAQRWSDIGVSAGVTVTDSSLIISIGDISSLVEGYQVQLTGKVVTAVFADCFFVEEPSRCAGIRCVEPDAGLTVGDRIDISGKVALRNGRKVLESISRGMPNSGDPLRPIGVPGRAIALGLPDPVGLYVTVYGRVTAIGSGYMVLDDGSRLESSRGSDGIEVRCADGSVEIGDLVSATGVLCVETVGDKPAIVVREFPVPGVTLQGP